MKIKRILIIEEEIEIQDGDTPENEAQWLLDFPIDFLDSYNVRLRSKIVDPATEEILAEINPNE